MSSTVVNGPPDRPEWAFEPLSGPAKAVAFGAFLAVMMTITGAYGTSDLSVIHRLALWGVVTSLLLSQVLGLTIWAERRRPVSWPTWIGPMAALVATVPLLAAELHFLKFTPLLPKAHDPFLPFMAFLTPPVVLLGGISLLLVPGWRALVTVTKPPHGQHAPLIRSIRAHDHYLEVRTETGRQFVRGALSEHVARLEGGLLVHRSWWIALDEVRWLERRGRDYVVVLANGSTAPVARSRLDAVRQALKETGAEPSP